MANFRTPFMLLYGLIKGMHSQTEGNAEIDALSVASPRQIEEGLILSASPSEDLNRQSNLSLFPTGLAVGAIVTLKNSSVQDTGAVFRWLSLIFLLISFQLWILAILLGMKLSSGRQPTSIALLKTLNIYRLVFLLIGITALLPA